MKITGHEDVPADQIHSLIGQADPLYAYEMRDLLMLLAKRVAWLEAEVHELNAEKKDRRDLATALARRGRST